MALGGDSVIEVWQWAKYLLSSIHWIIGVIKNEIRMLKLRR